MPFVVSQPVCFVLLWASRLIVFAGVVAWQSFILPKSASSVPAYYIT